MVLTRDAFDKAGRFDPEMASMQDWDLWLRVALIKPIHVLADAYVIYEDRSGVLWFLTTLYAIAYLETSSQSRCRFFGFCSSLDCF